MIRTAIVAVLLTLYTLIAGPFLLLHAWITGNPNVLYHAGVSGAYVVGCIVGLQIKVEGRDKIPAGTCLFLANHTSFVDALPIMWAVPRRVGVLLKESLFSIPLIGWAFRLAKFVPVERGNKESGMASVELAAERMNQGMSFLAYPEGTRSYDGRLLPFKKGVFILAIKARAKIIPMVMTNGHRIAPKGTLKIAPGEVIVRFGEPIDASSYTVDQRAELAKRVRTAMAALLPEDQQPIDLEGN
jgi:1-acyl-sn-glycerol-3-phosphate acyltransferase